VCLTGFGQGRPLVVSRRRRPAPRASTASRPTRLARSAAWLEPFRAGSGSTAPILATRSAICRATAARKRPSPHAGSQTSAQQGSLGVLASPSLGDIGQPTQARRGLPRESLSRPILRPSLTQVEVTSATRRIRPSDSHSPVYRASPGCWSGLTAPRPGDFRLRSLGPDHYRGAGRCQSA